MKAIAIVLYSTIVLIALQLPYLITCKHGRMVKSIFISWMLFFAAACIENRHELIFIDKYHDGMFMGSLPIAALFGWLPGLLISGFANLLRLEQPTPIPNDMGTNKILVKWEWIKYVRKAFLYACLILFLICLLPFLIFYGSIFLHL